MPEIIETKIPIDMIAKARIYSDEMGVIKNSIMQGGGNIYGFIGELLVADFVGVSLRHSYDYDMELPNRESIDVKTKKTGWPPKLDYDCTISAFNIKQKCTYYVFTRVKSDLSVGWLLGYLPKKEYFDAAQFIKKGELDPSNNFTAKTDMYNVKISQLKDMRDLLDAKKALDSLKPT